MKKINSAMLRIRTISLVSLMISSVYFSHALTISPARLEMSVDPGVQAAGEFTIVNEQNSDETYYTSVENFEAQGESGTPNFTPSKDGLASWVEVAPSIVIKKGEKIKIPFTVNAPKDADAGGHFAAIFLTTIPPTTKGGEVSVGAKVGMLLLLRVSGDIKEDGGVRSFTLKNGGHFVTTLPVDFVYRFSNNGNDREKPLGAISIRNMIGLETENLNANPTEGNVLPNSIRRFEVKWGTEEALPASASFLSFVKYEMRNFALGVYFANLDLSYGTNTKKAESSLFFVVFPWHLIIVIVLILAIIFALFKVALKKYNKFIIAQARLAMKDSGNK